MADVEGAVVPFAEEAFWFDWGELVEDGIQNRWVDSAVGLGEVDVLCIVSLDPFALLLR